MAHHFPWPGRAPVNLSPAPPSLTRNKRVMCKPNLLYSPTAPKVHVFSDRTPDLPFPGPLPAPSTLPLQQSILHRTTPPAYDATYAGRPPAQRTYTRINISCLLENSIHVYYLLLPVFDRMSWTSVPALRSVMMWSCSAVQLPMRTNRRRLLLLTLCAGELSVSACSTAPDPGGAGELSVSACSVAPDPVGAGELVFVAVY